MCGIAGILSLTGDRLVAPESALAVMNELQAHRGPDGQGSWVHPLGIVGMGHRRLSIIDVAGGAQPMRDNAGNWLVCNGEIYNYLELRDELGADAFHTASDTETILHAYRRWGTDCVSHLRGMFSFALWDEPNRRLFCARDRFGIKPLVYAQLGDVLYIASEAKALLPFLPAVETDTEALRDYLAFQFCLGGKTLFANVRELLPGHRLVAERGRVTIERYWEVYYRPDFDHTALYFHEQIRALLADSVSFHLRSDVPLGSYLSGGLDSSIVLSLATRAAGQRIPAFCGTFPGFPAHDESAYAGEASRNAGADLFLVPITVEDFVQRVADVIYALDYPLAGPGAFAQFMVSGEASRHRKVLLGGQGADEIFGGYTRYLVAYFEQCIKGAIDGTTQNGNFVVTYESIIPNLTALRNYKPMLREFWREGLFEPLEHRYYRLINRASSAQQEIRWAELGSYDPMETFLSIFKSDNVGKESYFDLMTHFDFKTLLPALLHVEDRVSMAHGLESRVPFLDHPLVALAATIPADVKFKDGTMKHALREAMRPILPAAVCNRQDKMGFPVPLTEWAEGGARDFLHDLFGSTAARQRPFVDNQAALGNLEAGARFDRKMWGLLSFELWQRRFHDQGASFRQRLDEKREQTCAS